MSTENHLRLTEDGDTEINFHGSKVLLLIRGSFGAGGGKISAGYTFALDGSFKKFLDATDLTAHSDIVLVKGSGHKAILRVESADPGTSLDVSWFPVN